MAVENRKIKAAALLVAGFTVLFLILCNFQVLQRVNHDGVEKQYPTIRSRKLQFEGMFDNGGGAATSSGSTKTRRKKGSAAKGTGIVAKRVSRPQALSKAVEEILLETDRYNLWWTGPPDVDAFRPADWGAYHSEVNNAIFSMAVIQGGADKPICSTPNDFKLFLGSARRYFR